MLLHEPAEMTIRIRRSHGRVRVRAVHPGYRPTDEARHPGLGSSDQAALVLGDGERDNRADALFDVTEAGALELDVSVSFAGLRGLDRGTADPGLGRRPMPATAFAAVDGRPMLTDVGQSLDSEQRLAVALDPERDVRPGATWSWDKLDADVRADATDGDEPYTFGHLFTQQGHISLAVTDRGVPVGTAEGSLLACDTRRLGSLYRRLIARSSAAGWAWCMRHTTSASTGGSR